MRALGSGIHTMAFELRARHRSGNELTRSLTGARTVECLKRQDGTQTQWIAAKDACHGVIHHEQRTGLASRTTQSAQIGHAQAKATDRVHKPPQVRPSASNEASKPSDAAENTAADGSQPAQHRSHQSHEQTHRQSHRQTQPGGHRGAQSPTETAPPAHARPQQDAPHARRPLTAQASSSCCTSTRHRPFKTKTHDAVVPRIVGNGCSIAPICDETPRC